LPRNKILTDRKTKEKAVTSPVGSRPRWAFSLLVGAERRAFLAVCLITTVCGAQEFCDHGLGPSPRDRRMNAVRPPPNHPLPVPDLYAELERLLEQIPRGRVTTYGALGQALGEVRAARWIATFLLDPDAPVRLPAHRVVLRDGALGEYFTGDSSEKARRLRSEGVAVKQGRVDLARFEFRDLVSSRPLTQLAELQRALVSRISLERPDRDPQLVAGVDTSYASINPGGPVEAAAAYALVDVDSGRLQWSLTVRRPVRFPYIPGFLTFRELPLYLELLAEARRRGKLADVVFVDGNGILHHRQAGIASHTGVAAGVPTIGVGKSLLCGQVDLKDMRGGEARPVTFEGGTLAMALRPGANGRPIFVSPGHRVDVNFAVDLARRLLRGHRVPEPIYHAHTLSRQAVGGAPAGVEGAKPQACGEGEAM